MPAFFYVYSHDCSVYPTRLIAILTVRCCYRALLFYIPYWPALRCGIGWADIVAIVHWPYYLRDIWPDITVLHYLPVLLTFHFFPTCSFWPPIWPLYNCWLPYLCDWWLLVIPTYLVRHYSILLFVDQYACLLFQWSSFGPLPGRCCCILGICWPYACLFCVPGDRWLRGRLLPFLVGWYLLVFDYTLYIHFITTLCRRYSCYPFIAFIGPVHLWWCRWEVFTVHCDGDGDTLYLWLPCCDDALPEYPIWYVTLGLRWFSCRWCWCDLNYRTWFCHYTVTDLCHWVLPFVELEFLYTTIYLDCCYCWDADCILLPLPDSAFCWLFDDYSVPVIQTDFVFIAVRWKLFGNLNSVDYSSVVVVQAITLRYITGGIHGELFIRFIVDCPVVVVVVIYIAVLIYRCCRLPFSFCYRIRWCHYSSFCDFWRLVHSFHITRWFVGPLFGRCWNVCRWLPCRCGYLFITVLWTYVCSAIVVAIDCGIPFYHICSILFCAFRYVPVAALFT